MRKRISKGLCISLVSCGFLTGGCIDAVPQGVSDGVRNAIAGAIGTAVTAVVDMAIDSFLDGEE